MTNSTDKEASLPTDKDESVSREFQLKQLMSEHMNDLVHTYKTFFQMSVKERKLGKYIDGTAAVGAAILTGNLFLNIVPTYVSIGTAIVIGIASGVSTLFEFESQANDYENAGDAYNSLFKEFKQYYRLIYTDPSIPYEEKRDKLEKLTERHRRLNSLTPTTDDKVYKNIDTEDILSNIQTTDDERANLLYTPSETEAE